MASKLEVHDKFVRRNAADSLSSLTQHKTLMGVILVPVLTKLYHGEKCEAMQILLRCNFSYLASSLLIFLFVLLYLILVPHCPIMFP